MKKLSARFLENLTLQEVDVFYTLEDHEKFVFISADEIYVKPAIRYRGGKMLAFAQNQINFLRGFPAFVARLVPVVNLKHEFLVDRLLVLISIIHVSGGFVMGIQNSQRKIYPSLNLIH